MQELNIRSRTGVRSNSGIQSIYSNIAKEFHLPITPDLIALITPELAIPELTSIENPMSTGIDPEPTSLRKVDAPPPLRIIPPLNFCPVERQLYRSGQPSVINQSFLKDLHLKTILWLASEEPQDDFLEFCTESNINIEFVGMYNEFHNYQAYSHAALLNPWDSLDESTIKRSLELIANRENYPLLVCCGMGRHRTGTIIGCLRRLQGWNLASVSEEYRRFTGSRGGRILVELLIEGFDINSVNIDPSKIPDWL